MSDIVIRVGTEEDLDAARLVLEAAYGTYRTWFPPKNWNHYVVDIVDLEGRAAESDLLLAERERNILGCVSYFPPGPKTSYPSDGTSERWPKSWSAFRLLGVHPDAQGLGVGRLLTDACIARARDDGAVALGLHTTAPMTVARAMYERLGFERTPRYDFRPGPEVLVEAYGLLL